MRRYTVPLATKVPHPARLVCHCALCGRPCRKRNAGWYCGKCEVYTSDGIEAAEEE